MQFTFQLRRGPAAEWTTDNPVLRSGEPGVEIDTGKFKIGDGVHAWTALSYFINEAAIDVKIDDLVLNGVEGKSAYEVAVDNGFVGTESQWLASLHGTNGTNGATGATGATGAAGATGAQGPAGDSAYDVAVTNGYVGSEVSWLASLQGADGADGTDGADGADYTGPMITVSSSAPSSPSVGDIWIDTSS